MASHAGLRFCCAAATFGLMPSGSHIACLRLDAFGLGELGDLRVAFGAGEPLRLRQAWLPSPEVGFLAGGIRTGWTPEALFVFAELPDVDIFSEVTEANQETWLLGDVFEIFLKSPDCAAYDELHVTPQNIRAHFHFTASGAPLRAVDEGIFSSRTWVEASAQRWFVFAEIPARLVISSGRIEPGACCHFSFSRYDAFRNGQPPHLSSTSSHSVRNFHRLEEWGVLSFQ